MSIFNRKYPIVNGKFDSRRHFINCMNSYNEIYNHNLTDTDITNNKCSCDNFLEESKWDYVTDIPSSWIIEIFAMGKRSTDRIVQILHTQNYKASKHEKVYDYDVYSTHIYVDRKK